MKKVGTGILGLGAISGIYLCNLKKKFQEIDILAVCDHSPAKAEKAAKQYEIPKVCRTLEDMLADDRIEIILNLTRPADHYETTKTALLAGRHVYSEKPLASSYSQGKELTELAAAKGLLLGCAPDTFLGAGIQTCKSLIEEGKIGKIIGAEARMMCRGHEKWHPSPEFYYRKGGGPMMDMGPYYLTAMVSLMGSVCQVSGMTGKGFEKRKIETGPGKGRWIDVEVPTYEAGLLRFESGAVGSVLMTFDVCYDRQDFLEIYGTEGTIRLPDPNGFGGKIMVCTADSSAFSEVPLRSGFQEESRGLGLKDMAEALRKGRKFHVNADQALHVLEIIEKIEAAGREACCLKMESCREGIRNEISGV